MPYGPGSNALITNALPPTGDTVEEAINKLDAQFDALYDALNAAEQQVDVQFRGEWAESTTYQCNDVVTSGGATYICKSETGAPAGTAVTNTTYWGEITTPQLEFATAEEVAAGTVTNKVVVPSALKPELDDINELIDSLEERAGALEDKVEGGQVYNADLLDGQHGNYYRCENGCSWTCSAECSGGCGNGCTGSCLAGCTGGCSSCTGSCTGSCSTGCSTTCTMTCTGSCTGCTGGCSGTCTSNCSRSCGNRGK